MCRLFGFRSSVVSTAHRSLSAAENSLARQAREHADGWGIGWYQGADPYLFKSQGGAAEDASFHRISERLASQTFLVHVRKATVGRTDPLNSHPFRHGRWMFAHNGTIHGFQRLRAELLAHTRPDLAAGILGDTDSEHLFAYLLSVMADAGFCARGTVDPPPGALARTLRAALDRLFEWSLREELPAPSLNFLLTNGSVMVAQRAGRSLYLATQKARCADVERCPAEKLCMAPLRPLRPRLRDAFVRRCNHLLVASEPIGAEDIWEEVPQGHLLLLSAELELHLFPPPRRFRLAPPP